MFSSSTTEEFGSLDGGYFGLLSVSYDLPDCFDAPECRLKLDYVYNRSSENNVSTRDLERVASLQFRFDSGRVGVRSDFSGGIGYLGQPDLLGLALVPYVRLTETVMLVGRYTFLHSFGDNGIRFKRYDSRVEPGRGDRYNELFLGLNWLLYGHRFKL